MLIIFWILSGVIPPHPILQVGRTAVPLQVSAHSCSFHLPPPSFSYPREGCHPCFLTLSPLKGTTLSHSPSIKGGAVQSVASAA